MSKTWYYSRGGKVTGPIRTDELKLQAALGVLRHSDLIWPSNSAHNVAVEAGAALDFLALKAMISALPDWISDVAKAEALASAPPQLATKPPDPGAPAWLADIHRLLNSPPSKPSPLPSWMLDFELAELASRVNQFPRWLTGLLPNEWIAVPIADPTGLQPMPQKVAAPQASGKRDSRAKLHGLAEIPPPPALPTASPQHVAEAKAMPAPPQEMPAFPAKLPETKIIPAPAPSQDQPTSPVKPPEAKAPASRQFVIEATGHDPETGQILDEAKYHRWQADQNRQEEARRAAQPTGPVIDPFQRARRELADWVDLDENQPLIKANDVETLRQAPFLQEFMRRQQAFGPEMVKKLCHYLDFMVENRRKFYEKADSPWT
jgi:hypothetical protein